MIFLLLAVQWTSSFLLKMNDKIAEHSQYIAEYGQDLEEVRDWQWHGPETK